MINKICLEKQKNAKQVLKKHPQLDFFKVK